MRIVQPNKQETVQRLRNEFHRKGWNTKQLHKFADVYMVFQPNVSEYLYFVAYISAGNGYFRLLPEKPELESYQEAQAILESITYKYRSCKGVDLMLETEKIWDVHPDILTQQLRNLCTFPRIDHRFPYRTDLKLNQPEATQPPELQLGTVVKHKYLPFPPGKICKIRWFPCLSAVSSLPGVYVYFIDTFPPRLSACVDDLLECNNNENNFRKKSEG